MPNLVTSATRACAECGSPFVSGRASARFCSLQCFGHAKAKRANRECESCGKAFYARPRAIAVGKGRWCSRQCSALSRRVAPATLICAGCGESFESTRRDQQYCRFACSTIRHGEDRACEVCGATFYASPQAVATGKGRWCSRSCTNRGRPKLGEVRSCATCGGDMYVTPSDISKRRRFCSKRCEGVATAVRQKGQTFSEETRAKMSAAARGVPKPWRRKPELSMTCQQCGKVGPVPKAVRWNAENRQFCNAACMYAYRREHPDATGKRVTGRKDWACEQCGRAFQTARRQQHVRFCSKRCVGEAQQTSVSHACGQCGVVFSVPPCRLRKRRVPGIYCSRACWVAYLRNHPDLVPRFRGGQRHNYGPDWEAQKRRARKRDQDTCRRCGLYQPRPRLHVHHLVPFYTFRGDWPTANELSNLVSLCRRCHTLTEWEYEMTKRVDLTVFLPEPA